MIKSDINPIIEVLNRCSELDSTFPLQYLRCFLLIAKNEGMTSTNLSQLSGLGISTISRIVHALADNRQKGKPYGLIKILPSKNSKREKELLLTQKGKEFLQILTSVFKAKEV